MDEDFNVWLGKRIEAIDELIAERSEHMECFSKESFQYLNDIRDGLLQMSSQIVENT